MPAPGNGAARAPIVIEACPGWHPVGCALRLELILHLAPEPPQELEALVVELLEPAGRHRRCAELLEDLVDPGDLRFLSLAQGAHHGLEDLEEILELVAAAQALAHHELPL